jgi:hypothetical protein
VPQQDELKSRGLKMVAVPYWREWYHSQHEVLAATCTGDAFEGYVSRVLGAFHDDFINPQPAGNVGDRKCDGLACSGKLFYACYGSRPEPGSTEDAIVSKIMTDFNVAVPQWSTFEEWRFVTNARTGPKVAAAIVQLQTDYGPAAVRPIRVRLWKPDNVWQEVVSKLPQTDLDLIFPGAPGVANVELSDLLPLIDVLNGAQTPDEDAAEIKEVPPTKMDFNALTDARRLEMNAGRRMAPRIGSWYETQSDPDLSDKHGAKFRRIYLDHAALHADSDEIMEALYESLAGAGFRRDSKVANCVYAVTAYFFDSCHIFETPLDEVSETDAVAH